MNEKAIAKWDRAVNFLDSAKRTEHIRYGVYKQSLFSKATGKIMLVAAGTGADFKYFAEGTDVTAIDFSPKMVERATEEAKKSRADIKVVEADVTDLNFEDKSFDSVVTSCTFCSVPEPVKGLKEVRRILKDDGKMFMFEHVRPTNFFLGVMMDIMNPVAKMFGPTINRRTADNVTKAGFRITREYNVYLDMVKLFEAVKA